MYNFIQSPHGEILVTQAKPIFANLLYRVDGVYCDNDTPCINVWCDPETLSYRELGKDERYEFHADPLIETRIHIERSRCLFGKLEFHAVGKSKEHSFEVRRIDQTQRPDTYDYYQYTEEGKQVGAENNLSRRVIKKLINDLLFEPRPIWGQEFNIVLDKSKILR